MSGEINPELQKWLQQFSISFGKELAIKQFEHWKKLQDKHIELQQILSKYLNIDFSKAQNFLDRAGHILRYDDDYKVVVIGETGAGKSTLLNAMLQERLLKTGGGAAITGTAIYVYPNQDIEHNQAEIFLRDEDEFKPLLIDISSQYLDNNARDELFGSEENITAAQVFRIAKDNQIIKHLGNIFSENEKQNIQDEILDIAATWMKIETIQKETKTKFKLPEELDELNSYLEEGGNINLRESFSRIIPAIKYAKFYLKCTDNSYLNENVSSNIVFVDVPGSAAKTLRHSEILRQEVKKANVIILVVKPDRPAEKEGASLANLLEQNLFKDYKPEEKRKFASRVFLVVNKADQIKNEEDKSRLNKSLLQLCDVIGDKKLLDDRCIEVIAEKSILALICRENIEIKTDQERRYYASLATCPVEELSNIDDTKLDNESGIPTLIEKLSDFLSKERVKLMLDEGEILLEKCVHSIKSTCSQILSLDPSTISTNHLGTISLKEKTFCYQTLEQDRQDLDTAKEELFVLVEDWIKSQEHQEKVSHKITSIFTTLKDSIKTPANYLLDKKNHKEGVLNISTSYITGKSYPNVDFPLLLLRIEEKFHRAVEENIKELADYYFHGFDSKVNILEIDALLEEKSYGQKYIEDIAPSTTMKNQRKRVHENLQAICRWILMYELLKMPIDLPLDPSRDDTSHNLLVHAFQETFKEIAPELVSLGGDTIQSMLDDILPLPLKRFIEVFSNLMKEKLEDKLEESAEKQNSATKRNKQTLPEKLLDKKELERKVIEYGKKKKIDELIELLQEQFAFRYSIAISVSLIYLERMFRYELGKYYLRLEEISNLLLGMHRSAVDLNYEDIREQLGKKHPDMSLKFQEASLCLKEILTQQ